jgi:aspartate/methionine/tyrosine aminotransferase
MNELARDLNSVLNGTVAGELLSDFGRRFYFPKGIVAQTSEAKKVLRQRKAGGHNLTAGMAYRQGQPLHHASIKRYLPEIEAAEIFAYSTTAGEPLLRELWLREIIRKNPGLGGGTTSLPLVVSGITHGLATVADLFVDPGDRVILPDMFWGNYRLIFEARKQATIETYPLFRAGGGFNVEGLAEAIDRGRGKAVIVLNFPNNPTGYSLFTEEAEDLAKTLEGLASGGAKLAVISDDAYFGMFYEEGLFQQSLFSLLASLHENILAIKLDGATKEEMAWGLRIGFLTFGSKGLSEPHYTALASKGMGAIRSSTSNASKLSQTLLLRALQDRSFQEEKEQAYRYLKSKYVRVKAILDRETVPDLLTRLPFNAGYFLCFGVRDGRADELRKKLLYEEGIGTVAFGEHRLRITYAIAEPEGLEDIFGALFRTAGSL